MPDLHELTAVQLGTAIAAGELSPLECVDHFLDRIQAKDGELAAFVSLRADRARCEAEALGRELTRDPERPRSPLFAVPTALKDLELVAGEPVTLGSAAFADFVAPASSRVAVTMSEGGAISLGKTAAPEFGLTCTTEPAGRPPTRNPWMPDRSPGGSSGGAAAAVAAGLLPWAQGGDGGGSIRIPASACGVVGLKPSRGRVSTGPGAGDVFGVTAKGPIARTVGDVAAALDLLARPYPDDPAPPPLPASSFLHATLADPRPLRIGVLRTPTNGVEVAQPCRDAVDRAADLAANLGHDVSELNPAPSDDIRDAFTTVWALGAATMPLRPEQEAMLQPITRYLRQQGAALDGPAAIMALARMHAVSRQLLAATAHVDIVLSPTLAQIPRRIGELTDHDDPTEMMTATARFTPFTSPVNMTGQPAISLPMHHDHGLPIGVHIIGRPQQDAIVLALAAQLERHSPWNDQHPPVW